MTTQERITKAKIWLITNRPWFGQLSCYVEPVENNNIPTAAIDLLGNLYYNTKFMEELSDSEIRGIICHEIMHLAFKHLERMDERDPLIWNMACDLKVNEEVKNMPNTALPGGALSPGFSGSWAHGNVKISKINEKTAEQIYYELKKQAPKVPKYDCDLIVAGDQKDDDGNGNDKKGCKKISKADVTVLGRAWQGRVYSATETAKGDTPAGVLREMWEMQNSELPWHNILKARYRKLGFKRSWKKPNKRYYQQGFYYAGRIKSEGIKMVAAIDTSGSMMREDLNKAVSELYGITKAFPFLDLWVTDCDAQIYQAKKYKKEEISRLILKGGGGTDFRPVFKWIEKDLNNQIDSLVFFTDLYGDFPTKKPPYSTFWVTETREHDIPFGRKLMLRNRE